MTSSPEDPPLFHSRGRYPGAVIRNRHPALLALRLTALLILLCAAAAPVLALDSQAIFERNEQAVYQIHVVNRDTGKKSSIGSGFIFDRPFAPLRINCG